MNFADRRLGRNPVKLIGINAPFQPSLQFGRVYDAAGDPRSSANAAWGNQNRGRGDQNEGIKQPLPAREQSILSHQLSPQMQSALRGGMRPLENKGRGQYQQKPVELHSVHLGAAIGHSQQRNLTVSACASPHGHMALRRVSGDYNYQV